MKYSRLDFPFTSGRNEKKGKKAERETFKVFKISDTCILLELKVC